MNWISATGRSIAGRDHRIVEAEFEAAANEFAEADALQHGLQNFDGGSVLMLIAFHFGADEACAAQDRQNRINRRRWPRKDEAAARREDAIRLTQNRFGIAQMFEYGEHDDVIELRRLERKWRGNVGPDTPPA